MAAPVSLFIMVSVPLAIFGVTYVGTIYQSNHPAITAVGASVCAALAVAMELAYQPRFSSVLHPPRGRRVLLYGPPGSGKTALLRALVVDGGVKGTDKRPTLSSAAEYTYNLRLDLEASAAEAIHIVDYDGSRPSQIVVDGSRTIFRISRGRKIDAIVFVVNARPSAEGRLTEQGLRTQLDDNAKYLNRYTLEPLLRMASWSDSLRAVALVIIGGNLFSTAASTVGSESSADTPAESFYSLLISEVRAVCESRGRLNFMTMTVDSVTADTARGLFRRLIDACR